MLNRIMRRAGMSGLAAVALLGMAGAATAGEPDAKLPTAEVYYGDLDLRTSNGRDQLEKRVKRAVRNVCPAFSREVQRNAQVRECHKVALNAVRPQIEMAVVAHKKGQSLAANRPADRMEIKQVSR